MKRASITQAKNRLSALLDRVRAGETIVIEDRGRPVARLESILVGDRIDPEGRLARLERGGLVRGPVALLPERFLTTSPPAPSGGVRASEILLVERRESR